MIQKNKPCPDFGFKLIFSALLPVLTLSLLQAMAIGYKENRVVMLKPRQIKTAISPGRKDTDKVFTNVDKMPEFPGGLEALNRFISKNARPPAIAYENGTRGMVVIDFIVEKDGTLSHVRVTKGIGDGCDEEALRVVKTSPKWIPGSQQGQPERVAFSIPILFTGSANIRMVQLAGPFGTSTNQKGSSVKSYGGKIYNKVDKYPDFPGGLDAFNKFITVHTIYPETAKAKNSTGKVVVAFIVETDGSLSDVHVIRSLDDDCDNEAVRVIKLLPQLIPAVLDNQAVRFSLAVPVSFPPAADVNPQDTLVKKLDIYPEFPGGIDALGSFLAHNIRYPVLARQNGVQGRVIVNFVVEKDGALSNIRVLHGIGSGCDEESLRVMRLSPKWVPGMRNGVPVRSSYSIPISFTLSE